MPAVFLSILRMCLLALWVLLGGHAAAYAESVSEPVSSGTVEKLEDRVIELEKETAVLKAELGAKIDAQDNRISDGIGLHGAQVTMLSNQTAQLGNLIQWMAIGIAVVGLIGGFFAFRRAEQIAKEESEAWFRANEATLNENIDNLQVRVNEVEKHAEKVKLEMTKTQQGVEESAAQARERIEIIQDVIAKGEKLSAEVVQQVRQDAIELDAKPRSQWTSEDFFKSGIFNYSSGDYATALKRFNVSAAMLIDTDEPKLLANAAEALFNKGVTLRADDHLEEAIAAYDDVVERFGAHKEPPVLEQVAKALVNKGFALRKLGRAIDAIEVYDDVLQRFGSQSDPTLLESAASALFNKGHALFKLGRLNDAIDAYDEMVLRFGARNDLPLLVLVAKALVNKGAVFGQLNHPEDEVAVYDEVVRRFGASGEPELLVRVAIALVNKGIALEELDRPEEAAAIYGEVVRRFRARSEPELLEQVAKARVLLSKLRGEQK